MERQEEPGGRARVEAGRKSSPIAWLALSAAGSFALAAVTNFQTHDLTPAPLLWALPLAIYLLSFIITFEHERWYRRDVALLLIAGGLLAVIVCMARDEHGFVVRCLAFGAFQLGLCLAAHGELYRLKPEPERLGSYYLWLAVGGALGTVVVSAVFPLLARDYLEFPVLVVAGALGGIALLPKRRLARALGSLCLVLLIAGFAFVWLARRKGQAFSDRNFFGVIRVEKDDDAWALIHGGTVHGRQLLDPEVANEPTAYFTRETGLGQAVRSLRERRGGAPLQAAVLGLGIGTSVALFEQGDEVVFYEIDPAVVRLAEGEGGWFRYLKNARARWRVVLGDARTALAATASTQELDLLAVDVFSGDAVPMHLLTQEALELYLQHLKPDGVLALHLSNRFFQLDRVALSLAKELQLSAIAYQNPATKLAASATWVLLARSEEALPKLDVGPGGTTWREAKRPAPWTDDLASVLSVMR